MGLVVDPPLGPVAGRPANRIDTTSLIRSEFEYQIVFAEKILGRSACGNDEPEEELQQEDEHQHRWNGNDQEVFYVLHHFKSIVAV